MGVIEDTGMSDRDKMEMMIEVSGIHTLPLVPIAMLFSSLNSAELIPIPQNTRNRDFMPMCYWE